MLVFWLKLDYTEITKKSNFKGIRLKLKKINLIQPKLDSNFTYHKNRHKRYYDKIKNGGYYEPVRDQRIQREIW